MITIYEKEDGSYRVVRPDTDSDINPEIFSDKYKAQVESLVAQGTAELKPYSEYIATWRESRKNAYGTVEEQIEYLVENGVDALIARNNQIKSNNPKT